jgi:hypothetical protein
MKKMGRPSKPITKRQIKRLYIDLKFTLLSTACLLEIGTDTLRKLMKKYNIQKRSHGWKMRRIIIHEKYER